MAFRCQRVFLLFRKTTSNAKLLDPFKNGSVLAANSTQVANLTSVQSHGFEVRKEVPWPYETRPYNQYWQFIDHTRKRFNDNTKVIILDGNVASGKSEMGEKIAKEFDMKFFPDTPDDDIFKTGTGFDLRELNEQLTPSSRFLDFATFHMQEAPPSMLKSIGRTQLSVYRNRFLTYALALEHLLNTGQGVILERGPWSDLVFADTLRKLGYMSPKALKYYNEWRANTVCELWKPHLVIYLDAPVSVIRQRINKRGVPSEVKGKVVTDEYLASIESVYKKKILPFYRRYSHVLTWNITDLPDWDIIVEDLERLDLDSRSRENEDLLVDWSKEREDDWNHYRCIVSSKWQLENLFRMPLPWEAPELMISGDEMAEYQKVVEQHPEVMYQKGYVRGKDEPMFFKMLQ